jgi:hypothetical protein
MLTTKHPTFLNFLARDTANPLSSLVYLAKERTVTGLDPGHIDISASGLGNLDHPLLRLRSNGEIFFTK